MSEDLRAAMPAYQQPYVIQCVERASQQAAVGVRANMRRGMTTLASIAATAPLLGFFGTMVGVAHDSFRSFSTKSEALIYISNGMSLAMIPGMLGLFVSVIAFWFYKYLVGQLDAFDLEMKSASIDLANRLTVHLERLRKVDAPGWRVLSRTLSSSGSTAGSSIGLALEVPRFAIGSSFPNGIIDLILPSLESAFDAWAILRAAAWICFAYGIAGFLVCLSQERTIAAFIIFAFYAVVALAIERGSQTALVTVCAFSLFASAACIIPYGVSLAALCLLAAPVPFVGSFQAVRYMKLEKRAKPAAFRLDTLLIALLALSASIAVLFGTAFALYPTQPEDSSMSPAIYPGDWLIAVNAPLMGRIHRGELVGAWWDGPNSARVVGLPGDRVQVKAGVLSINGQRVRESYGKAYTESLGDFPLPSSAYPDNQLRSSHAFVYGDRMTRDTIYVVPRDSYFVLNDDRAQLSDSRMLGPLWLEYVSGKLLLAFRIDGSWRWCPRSIR